MTPAIEMSDGDRLAGGLAALNLSVSSEKQSQLLAYAEEFRKWNRIHNLSAVDANEEFISLHLLDSLAVAEPLMRSLEAQGLVNKHLVFADLGAGGGLPGIPLAIIFPQWRFVLVEAVKKKAAFLQHIKGKLKLENLEVVGDRIENLAQERPNFADATISRAFSELKNFVDFSSGLLKPDGLIFAMKSQKAEEELAAMPSGWVLLDNAPIKVPMLEANRCLLTIQSVRK